MSISEEEFQRLLKRHKHRTRGLNLTLSLVDTLYKADILDRRRYRDMMNEWDYRYEAAADMWHEIKLEYQCSRE